MSDTRCFSYIKLTEQKPANKSPTFDSMRCCRRGFLQALCLTCFLGFFASSLISFSFFTNTFHSTTVITIADYELANPVVLNTNTNTLLAGQAGWGRDNFKICKQTSTCCLLLYIYVFIDCSSGGDFVTILNN
jgi:hypothetical protein